MNQDTYLPPRGFRDITPEEAYIRYQVANLAANLAQSFGFVPIETPTVEYKSVLMGKYGEEADKLIFDFTDRGGRQVALRYDQTVPLARYINRFRPPLPFKRYQIQSSFRAEKPQKGRSREFTQIDFDIVGDDGFVSDAEILWLTANFFDALNLPVTIYYNSRQILYAIFNQSNVPQNLYLKTAQIIDKLDKLPKTRVTNQLSQAGLSNQTIQTLWTNLAQAKPDDNLNRTIKLITPYTKTNFAFEPFLVRGLDYYTGLIFEVKLKNAPGSLAGGGRYDRLIKQDNRYLPAVGVGIGLDRVVEVLKTTNRFLPLQIDAVILVLSDTVFDYAFQVANILRRKNKIVTFYPDSQKALKKGYKYAKNLNARQVIFIGPDEKNKSYVTIKDIKTNKQTQTPLNQL